MKLVHPYPLRIIVAIVALLTLQSFAFANQESDSEGTRLRAKYQELKSKLERSPFGVPLYLESRKQDRVLSVHLYGVIEHPFQSMQAALQDPAQWCEVAILHLNVKACTYKKTAEGRRVTLYSGKRFYQEPSDAYKLNYLFQSTTKQMGYQRVLFTAKEGPFSTTDHRMEFETVPLDDRRTFLHFSYSHAYSVLTSIASSIYFATAGRERIGFSISSYDEQGNPVYMEGLQGAIERNAMRYYLAFIAYMESMKLPEAQRFEKRLTRWYDLTDRYRKQLFEVEKKEYLNAKAREYKNQRSLQDEIDQGEK